MVEEFHAEVSEDIFFVALESKLGPETEMTSALGLNSQEDYDSGGALHLEACHCRQSGSRFLPWAGQRLAAQRRRPF